MTNIINRLACDLRRPSRLAQVVLWLLTRCVMFPFKDVTYPLETPCPNIKPISLNCQWSEPSDTPVPLGVARSRGIACSVVPSRSLVGSYRRDASLCPTSPRVSTTTSQPQRTASSSRSTVSTVPCAETPRPTLTCPGCSTKLVAPGYSWGASYGSLTLGHQDYASLGSVTERREEGASSSSPNATTHDLRPMRGLSVSDSRVGLPGAGHGSQVSLATRSAGLVGPLPRLHRDWRTPGVSHPPHDPTPGVQVEGDRLSPGGSDVETLTSLMGRDCTSTHPLTVAAGLTRGQVTSGGHLVQTEN
jgi:hypothetical protein